MMKKLVGLLRRGSHFMRSDVSTFIHSPEFEAAINTINKNEDAKAFLMIAVLKQIALDPLSGDNPEAFYTIDEDLVAFHIRFNRFVNFIGWITLPVKSMRVAQLIESIKNNLESRMYKAAKIHRRLDQRRIRLHEQAKARALVAWRTSLNNCDDCLTYTERNTLANEAFELVLEPRVKTIDTRIQNVARCANPAFSGMYTTQDVGEFFYWHLPV